MNLFLLIRFKNFINKIKSLIFLKLYNIDIGSNYKISFPIKIKYDSNFSLLKIGKNFISGPNLRLELINKYYNYEFNPKVCIKDNVSFNDNVHIGVINYLEIGNFCLFGSNILITDHSHGNGQLYQKPIKFQKLHSKGPVVINDNVWIGDNVSILPGVTIGKNSIIGANSVVTKDIAPNSVYAGSPAILIKKLDEKES